MTVGGKVKEIERKEIWQWIVEEFRVSGKKKKERGEIGRIKKERVRGR